MAKTRGALRWDKDWQSGSTLKPLHEVSKFSPIFSNILQDVLPHGVPRGAITEVHGMRSSGRTSVCLHMLAHATGNGEVCALVDLENSFHPESGAEAGVKLENLVWVRCGGNVEFALRATDLLLHAGGFGAVSLDLCEGSFRVLNRIPISYWHRFKRAIENTPTALLICANKPQAKSCAYSNLYTKLKAPLWVGPAHFSLLGGVETYATAGKVASIRPQPLFLQSGV